MMSRKPLIFVGIGLAVLIGLFGLWLLWAQLFAPKRGDHGPTITAAGVDWNTRIIEGEDGHNLFAIWVIFEAEASDATRAISYNGPFLEDLCNRVLVQWEEFVPNGVERKNLEHVDLNVVVGGARAHKHDLTLYADENGCTGGFEFAYLTEREDTASQHDFAEEARALLAHWGMKRTHIGFSNNNGLRHIDVTYTIREQYERDPSKLSPWQACVRTLALMPKQMNFVLFRIDPRNYTEMRLSVVEALEPGLFGKRQHLGSAVVPLKDGVCQRDPAS